MLSAPKEFVIGGLLIAPFARDALIALVAFLCLRPLLHRLPLARTFANPPLVEFSLYVCVVGLVTVLI